MNIDEVKARHEAFLLTLPHVVGVGRGSKKVKGEKKALAEALTVLKRRGRWMSYLTYLGYPMS